MAWEPRGKGENYYYRVIRDGGRPRRIYLGKGETARRAAAEVDRRREEQAAQAALAEAEEARYSAAVDPFLALCKATDLLVTATLTGMGYHRHCRGEWRRRRHVENNEGIPGGTEVDPGAGERG